MNGKLCNIVMSAYTIIINKSQINMLNYDVVPVARLEAFRALKLSKLESFRALKFSRLESFRALNTLLVVGTLLEKNKII